MRLGIDLGATRTVVAVAIDGRHPVTSFDAEGPFSDHVPGRVARRADGIDGRISVVIWSQARGYERSYELHR